MEVFFFTLLQLPRGFGTGGPLYLRPQLILEMGRYGLAFDIIMPSFDYSGVPGMKYIYGTEREDDTTTAPKKDGMKINFAFCW